MPSCLHPGTQRTALANPVGALSQLAGIESVARRQKKEGGDDSLPRFRQRRFYDFNVWSLKKKVEKLHYMHMNPLKRKLVDPPKDWPWSSFSFYSNLKDGLIKIDPAHSEEDKWSKPSDPSKNREGSVTRKFKSSQKMGHPPATFVAEMPGNRRGS